MQQNYQYLVGSFINTWSVLLIMSGLSADHNSIQQAKHKDMDQLVKLLIVLLLLVILLIEMLSCRSPSV